jgi:hypothetical protein
MRVQRWNSWTAFWAEVSGHKLESSQNQVLVWISTLIFPFYKLLFKAHTKTRFPIGQILDMYIIESAWLYWLTENFLIVIYFMHSKSPMTNIDWLTVFFVVFPWRIFCRSAALSGAGSSSCPSRQSLQKIKKINDKQEAKK